MAIGLGLRVRVRVRTRSWVRVRFRVVFWESNSQFYAFRIAEMRNGYGGRQNVVVYTRMLTYNDEEPWPQNLGAVAIAN